jgi:hypothetical protein
VRSAREADADDLEDLVGAMFDGEDGKKDLMKFMTKMRQVATNKQTNDDGKTGLYNVQHGAKTSSFLPTL